MQKILSFFRAGEKVAPEIGATAESMPSTPMKVCFFQLQILSEFYSGPADATNFLRSVDPNCPVPQALEGGNGRGPLYQCILDAEKKEKLLKAIERSSQLLIVGSFGRGEVDRGLYRPDCYAHWNFGADPSLSISPY